MFFLPTVFLPTVKDYVKNAALLACLMLAGCTDSQTHSANSENASSVSLSIPVNLASARAVDLNNVYAEVDVEGFPIRTFTQQDQISTNFTIPDARLVRATVRWLETLPDGTALLLAAGRIEQQISGSTELTVDEYITEGIEFDADMDGFSNLSERRANSDPLDIDDLPVAGSDIDVRIGFVDPADAPQIDGFYDAIYTSNAQFRDDEGELLLIHNLMIDQGALRADGDTEFRWFAMHDDQFLYIFVFGESVALATPFRDSGPAWQDDSIDIFVDADNSKGSTYDGINDRHFIIPLLTGVEDTSGPNTTYLEAGPNSASLPSIQFATCVCGTGQHTWEVALPLGAFGITRDTPFGFEVQINEDNDGGARDAKWAWIHPSRSRVDTDNTFRSPAFMGTAVIR
jgi:hypothetical protein